jgi:hypothetical protein
MKNDILNKTLVSWIDPAGTNAEVHTIYGKWIATIHGRNGGNNGKEFQALISAITAVPEMIAALEEIVRWCNEPNCEEPLDLTTAVLALRKARGRE